MSTTWNKIYFIRKFQLIYRNSGIRILKTNTFDVQIVNLSQHQLPKKMEFSSTKLQIEPFASNNDQIKCCGALI